MNRGKKDIQGNSGVGKCTYLPGKNILSFWETTRANPAPTPLSFPVPPSPLKELSNKDKERIRKIKEEIAIKEGTLDDYEDAPIEIQRELERAEMLRRKLPAKINHLYRYKNEPQYRIRHLCATRLWAALRRSLVGKDARTFDLIGCSPAELVEHIEKQFTDGMSWDRLGEIHIDHRIPCARFDLTEPDALRACFHYTNLQPLWARDNLMKNDKSPDLAWFFSPTGHSLFVGISGKTYPDSWELEEIPDWMSLGGGRLLLHGQEMVMKWIDPYTVARGGTLTLTKGITIYHKEVW